MEIKGKRVALLCESMFNIFEFWYPYYRLKEAGADVVVIGSGSASEYKGKDGTVATVDVNAGDVTQESFDGVVIPGGYAPDIMRRYPAMVNFVREMHEAGKVVAAICHAGWMLASAEILHRKTVTSYFSIKDDMVNAGANWVDEEVVIDENLITSRTPADLPAFMRAVIEALGG